MEEKTVERWVSAAQLLYLLSAALSFLLLVQGILAGPFVDQLNSYLVYGLVLFFFCAMTGACILAVVGLNRRMSGTRTLVITLSAPYCLALSFSVFAFGLPFGILFAVLAIVHFIFLCLFAFNKDVKSLFQAQTSNTKKAPEAR